MYRGLKIIAVVPCFNEEKKIGSVVQRIRETGFADEILVVDDGSTDDSGKMAQTEGAKVLALPKMQGVGAALRHGFHYARDRCDVVVIVAGNNKDEPKEISRLLDPIKDGRAVFVQGSRFLARGVASGAMPYYRKFATRLHPLLFSLATRHWITESTNGFRAFRAQLLKDPKIALDQPWLDHYELEPYLYYKVVTLGHSFTEVPVTKIYPPKSLGQTKMPPIIGWWSILRPLFLLRFGLKT